MAYPHSQSRTRIQHPIGLTPQCCPCRPLRSGGQQSSRNLRQGGRAGARPYMSKVHLSLNLGKSMTSWKLTYKSRCFLAAEWGSGLDSPASCRPGHLPSSCKSWQGCSLSPFRPRVCCNRHPCIYPSPSLSRAATTLVHRERLFLAWSPCIWLVLDMKRCPAHPAPSVEFQVATHLPRDPSFSVLHLDPSKPSSFVKPNYCDVDTGHFGHLPQNPTTNGSPLFPQDLPPPRLHC